MSHSLPLLREATVTGTPVSRRPTRCALWLFACLQIFYVITASGRLHTIDEYEAYYMTESLAERGELALPNEKGFFGRQGKDGKFYAPYGPLSALVSLPGYLAGKSVAGLAGSSPQMRESLLWFFTALTNTTLSAASATLFFLLAWRLGAPALASLLTALVFALATLHWHYATTFFSEPLSALLLLAAAHGLLGCLGGPRDRVPVPSLILAGLPLALLAATRLATAILFPVLGLAVMTLIGRGLRGRLLAAASYCLLPALAIALYLWWNHARFGNPLQPGYPPSVEGRPSAGFDQSFLLGFYGLTLSPGKGLLVFALPALVGLWASREFVRRTGKLGAFLLAIPVVPLLFYSKYSYWEGGYCCGPRYLLPSIALWVLPLAFYPFRSRTSRWAAALASAWSIVVQFLAISVSFLECQVNRGYYTADFRYNLCYRALTETTSVLCHYVREALNGRFLEESEGLGFDRWFFFLYKSGFSGSSLSMIVLGLLVLQATAVVALYRTAGELREPCGTARARSAVHFLQERNRAS